MGSEFQTDHENLVDEQDQLREERNRLKSKAAELERRLEEQRKEHERSNLVLERAHAGQLKALSEAIEKNATKVGEAISLKVQFDALKNEHAKCGGPVNDKKIADLQRMFEQANFDKAELRKQKDELRRELDAAHALVDERDNEIADLKASLESLNEEAADENVETFTLDDIRDVVREELRADRRRRS